MAEHWTAEENWNFSDDDRLSGHIIRYDPMPGGRKNEDGTTTYTLTFSALVVTQYVSDPAKAAHDIANALNADDAKDRRIAELEAQIAEAKAAATAAIGEDDAEKAAKWHDREAERAMGSLNCGSENWEYRAAHRVCDNHRLAARAIRFTAARNTVGDGS